MRVLLYLTVFALSVCGLVYQLLVGAVASYLLGESVTWFSLVVGLFLSGLGVGAALSRLVTERPGPVLLEAGLSSALVGGLAPMVLFLAFARSGFFFPLLVGLVLAVGVLVGVQLPLLLRLLRRWEGLRSLAARALAVDYAGAVVGALLLGLVALPRLGMVRTGLAAGLLQVLATWLGISALGPSAGDPRPLRRRTLLVGGVFAVLLFAGQRLTVATEDGLYPDAVVLSRRTPYQHLTVTAGHGSTQLFLDGNLQFSSLDEHRYHEALVHPAMALAPGAQRVLVLGGGDGLAVRELLRYPSVRSVTLVDLDEEMTHLARTFAPFTRLNGHSLDDPRVHLVHADAMVWLGEGTERFDAVIVDFPDPNNYALGKLYTLRFYRLLRERLTDTGALVVQSTSPMAARQSFWCIARTMEAAGLSVRPYHTPVPSFGEWGYVLASPHAFEPPQHTLPGLRYLTDALLPTLFVLSADMGPVPAEINRLNNQVLVRYYEQEWRRYVN